MAKAGRKEQLQFAQSMLRELQGMIVGEAFLSYLVEMAYLEASDLIREIHAKAEGAKGEGGEARPLCRAA